MTNVTVVKRWKISETLLQSAHRMLPLPQKKEEEEQFRALERAFAEYLDHNEHELALDMLQELGELVRARGGFWKELIRAAENMALSSRIVYFKQKYEEALSRLSAK